MVDNEVHVVQEGAWLRDYYLNLVAGVVPWTLCGLVATHVKSQQAIQSSHNKNNYSIFGECN